MAIPHQQLYDEIHAGPGIEGTRATQDTYARVGDLFEFVDEQLRTGLARLGVAYEGAGSDAARSGISVLGQWTQDAQAGARYAGELVAYQAQSYARARNAMPEPVQVSAQDGFIDSIYDLFGGTTPREAQEQRAVQAHTRAAEVMRAYDEQSAEAADAMPAFLPPPPVTVDMPPPPDVSDAAADRAAVAPAGTAVYGGGAAGYGGGGAANTGGSMWQPPQAHGQGGGAGAPGAVARAAATPMELAAAPAAAGYGGAPAPGINLPSGAGSPATAAAGGYLGGMYVPGVGYPPRAATIEDRQLAGRSGPDRGFGPRGSQPARDEPRALARHDQPEPWGRPAGSAKAAAAGGGAGLGYGNAGLERGGGAATLGPAGAGYLQPAVPGGGHCGGTEHRRRYALVTDDYFADERLVPPPVIGLRPQP